MALRKIALHFDVISPYSWIGFELLHRHNSFGLNLFMTILSELLKDLFHNVAVRPDFIGDRILDFKIWFKVRTH